MPPTSPPRTRPARIIVAAHRVLGVALVVVGAPGCLLSLGGLVRGGLKAESSAGAAWVVGVLAVAAVSALMIPVGLLDQRIAGELERGSVPARRVAWVFAPLNLLAVPVLIGMVLVDFVAISLWLG